MPVFLPPAPDNAKAPRIDPSHYNLKVGDLCYAIIGVIVDRPLDVEMLTGNVPGAAVSSPLVSPQLAAAVRADWKGLTPEDHAKSLDEDGWMALRNLLYYYPGAGVAKATRMLGAEFYDEEAVGRVMAVDYKTPPDKAAMEKKIAIFRKKSGETAYRALEQQLVWAAGRDYNPGPATDHYKALVDALVKDLFPGVDPAHPPDFGLTTPAGESTILEQIGDFPSPEIDRAVYDLLKRVAARPAPPATGDSDQEQFEHRESEFGRFGLVCDCVWRLTPPRDRGALLKTLQAMGKTFLINKPDPKTMAAFDTRFDKFLQSEPAKLAPE